MPVLPKIVYNFNENDATTIRDYSENGNDGTGSTLDIVSSSRVGNDAKFDNVRDRIVISDNTVLNGVADCAIHLGISITNGGSGVKKILTKTGQLEITYSYTTNIISFSLTVNSGTAVVTDTISENTFYDLDLNYSSDVLTLYKDGVSVDSDATQSGIVASNTNTMLFGDTVISGCFMLINEFKLYDEAITTDIIDAVINQPNGIYSDDFIVNGYAVGDVIFTDYGGSPKYGIISYVGSATDYRFLPLSSGILSSMKFRRGGHLWDTTRQWGLLVDDTPKICFYDGQSKSSEIFADAKKTTCITKDGITGGNIVKNSVTKTANYTVLSSDERIYVDSSGGAFTITLEASPGTDRELEIIDSVGSCSTNNVTIDGNGNNINGSTTGLIASNNEAWSLVYNGTQWNLK